MKEAKTVMWLNVDWMEWWDPHLTVLRIRGLIIKLNDRYIQTHIRYSPLIFRVASINRMNWKKTNTNMNTSRSEAISYIRLLLSTDFIQLIDIPRLNVSYYSDNNKQKISHTLDKWLKSSETRSKQIPWEQHQIPHFPFSFFSFYLSL